MLSNKSKEASLTNSESLEPSQRREYQTSGYEADNKTEKIVTNCELTYQSYCKGSSAIERVPYHRLPDELLPNRHSKYSVVESD